MTEFLPLHIDKSEYSDKMSVDVALYMTGGKYGKNRKYICRVYGEGTLSNLVADRDAYAKRIQKSFNMHDELVRSAETAAMVLYSILGELERNPSTNSKMRPAVLSAYEGLRSAIAKGESK